MTDKIAIFLVQLIFYIIVPAIVIYFKILKRINFSFLIGAVLVSLTLGLLVQSTIKKQDEIENLINYLNTGQVEQAKREYKIIIQYGPKHVNKIDLDKITNHELYRKIKDDIIVEYKSIIFKYLDTYPSQNDSKIIDISCAQYEKYKAAQIKMKHASVLVGYTESIGGEIADVRPRIDTALEVYNRIVNNFKEKCDSK